MSEHHVKITWAKLNSSQESYHWSFDNGTQLKAVHDGSGRHENDIVDPESAYVASLSSCHMLSFLAIAAKRGVAVVSYVDDAVGVLEKNEHGRIAVTRVVLRPHVTFSAAVSHEEMERLHEMAHRNCFIANSVHTRISIEPQRTAEPVL